MPDTEDDSELSDAVEWYDDHADEAVGHYESLAPEKVNEWLRGFLPDKGGFILDVGAGSGRDAAWLSKDHDVIAVEPSEQMRKRGQELHAADGIIWLDDRLPGLEKVHECGVSFDFILMNAVWMHLAQPVRERAFRKLVTLLRPGGRLAISFRQPDPHQARSMFKCHDDEIERLARDRGLLVEKRDLVSSEGTRTPVEWTCFVLRLPDDSTSGAFNGPSRGRHPRNVGRPHLRQDCLRDGKPFQKKLSGVIMVKRVIKHLLAGTGYRIIKSAAYLRPSYSQEGEDILINKFLNNKKNGFYIDIGSNHPYADSNTVLLRNKGWNGINIEPNPDLFKLFLKECPHHINLNCGVGSSNGILKYYMFNDSRLNTFSQQFCQAQTKSSNHRLINTIDVNVKTLNEIIEQYVTTHIDLLTVDAETFEFDILKSFDFGKYSPTLIVIELLSTYREGPKIAENDPVYKLIVSHGYQWVACTGLTYFFKKSLS